MVGSLFFFFLSETKSNRLPTADCGGESFLFFLFLSLSPKDSPLQIVVGSLFFFFLSETKSKRLPTAHCGGESFLFFSF